jgi:hypothetical protein
MACEKYSGWITDAALDGLSPARLAEFNAHISRCALCHQSFEEIRVLTASIDSGLKSLVSAEPSPLFQVKLRAYLAAESMPSRRTRFAWAPIGALAAALLAIVTIAIFPIEKNASHPLQPLAVTLDASVTKKQSSLGGRSFSSDKKVEPLTRALAPEGLPRYSFHKNNRQPEVLVQPGQFALIKQFANGVSAGQINGYQAVEFQQQSESGNPLEIEPVDISPLGITALADVEKSDGGS